jgi:transcriptional adapter 2-alpha
MKTNQKQGKISRAVFAFALLFVAAIVLSTTANAQNRYPNNDQNRRDRNFDQYPDYGGSAELRQTALNAGYDQGVRQGNYDRQNGSRQSNYRNSDIYRRATQDYNSRLGDRELYRRYFREAFENGYNSYGNNQGNSGRDNRNQYPDRDNNGNRTRRGRNWDGYGNFGGSAELRQTALNAGYNEGNKQGKKDQGKRNNYNYQSQSTYQNATKDYNSRLGDRGVYQRYFREAYENGYSDGVYGY